jgi:hypothetical protein
VKKKLKRRIQFNKRAGEPINVPSGVLLSLAWQIRVNLLESCG